MLTALDRDTPQTKDGLTPHYLPKQEPNTFQEPPWLWFTLPELEFPLLTDEYRRPIHPEIEEYMGRHVSNDQCRVFATQERKKESSCDEEEVTKIGNR